MHFDNKCTFLFIQYAKLNEKISRNNKGRLFMAKYSTKENLVLNDKVKFDNKGGAILGVLEGPVADFINPTRNGRHYGEQL